jgi:hypothetical protein
LPERWPEFGERDKTNPWLTNIDGSSTTFAELVSKAPASLQGKLTRVAWQRQFAASHKAYADVLDAFELATPVVAVVMGVDENEWFKGAASPRLAVYRGATWTWGPNNTVYPVAVALTDHVTRHLQDTGYTIDVFDTPVDGKQMPHSFGLHYDRLLKAPIPMVPILVNIHFPPTQPSMIEQYRLGQAVRTAVESWGGNEVVAVLADGGLSIGVVREDLDRRLLDALQHRDLDALENIPYKWIQGPCGEIFNWIGAAGVLEGLEMKVWDYVPTYRSPAGTGCGNAFATWSPA